MCSQSIYEVKELKEQYSKMKPEPARQETDREIQKAVSKAGNIPAGSLGETIDRAMEIYKCRIDGSGGTQQTTKYPALNGRGR